jgi:hypothetical protein
LKIDIFYLIYKWHYLLSNSTKVGLLNMSCEIDNNDSDNEDMWSSVGSPSHTEAPQSPVTPFSPSDTLIVEPPSPPASQPDTDPFAEMWVDCGFDDFDEPVHPFDIASLHTAI